MSLCPHLEALAKLGIERIYKTGANIVHEGETAESMFIVRSGSVKVVGLDVETGREIAFGVIAAGGYFGEMSLDGGVRSASVVALESVQCAVVPNSAVLGFLPDNPEFAKALLFSVIDRARRATETARELALSNAYARLVKTLNKLANADKVIAPKVTHSELASLVGSSREMISKIVKDLEKGGYLRSDKTQITLLKRLPTRW